MNASVVIMLAIALVLGGVLFYLITITKQKTSLDVEKFRVKWLEIENSIDKSNESTYHMAVLNADKLLDLALKDRGIIGNTMGDRLKNTRGMLTNRDDVWSAHKLRNRVAHEQNVRISYNQLRRALSGFKQALRDLGAI